MGRPSTGGHIRWFPRHGTAYRLLSVTVDGVRRQRFEHRIVMERILGRPLHRGEVVHHRDGNGLNNTPGNLEVMSQAVHQRLHLSTGCAWDVKRAIELRRNGRSLAEIGRACGVSWSTVRERFVVLGIRTDNLRHGKYGWNVDAALTAFRNGASIALIARNSGVSASSVRKALRRRGAIA